MSNLTVFHIEKGKGSGGALGNHIDRTEGKEHSYKNADSTKSHLNRTLNINSHSLKPLQKGIKDRIKEGYTGKRAVRSDAVKYMKVILSGSHEQMKKIESSGNIESWTRDSVKWLSEQFGKENIVKAVLHLDEKTPHIHAVIVPLVQEEYSYINKDDKEIIVKKGALSAKEILHSPAFFRSLHTDYAVNVGLNYGLMRGEERKPGDEKTPVTTLNEFYHQVNKADDKRELNFKVPKIDKPSKVDLFRGEAFQEEQNESIKEQLTESIQETEDIISNLSFRTASEIIKEKKYKEDIQAKKYLKEKIVELKENIVEKDGGNIILRKNNDKLKDNNVKLKEHLKNVIEGRYDEEKIKGMAKQLGARLIKKDKGFDM